MYQTLLKPFFFLFAPERAHHLTLALFKIALALPGVGALMGRLFRYRHPKLRQQLFGLAFENPVGLAAGFDKDGKHYRSMAKLGFGFLELGTVTPRPQPGNPKPRLFRLPKDEALINRLGFNNDGVEALVQRLKQYGKPEGVLIGGNIGKNKTTPNDQAAEDYRICFRALHPYVDYFVVNVSSPNTPNLRDLQEKEPLSSLLRGLQEINRAEAQPKPILLKIAPDLTDGQLDDILDIVQDTQIDGIIATNTTISREGLATAEEEVKSCGAGGLSGQPVKKRSTEVIRYLSEKSGGSLPIIGVGGVAQASDALEKLQAGAVLVQLYTGLVYEGPGVVRRINEGLLRLGWSGKPSSF